MRVALNELPSKHHTITFGSLALSGFVKRNPPMSNRQCLGEWCHAKDCHEAPISDSSLASFQVLTEDPRALGPRETFSTVHDVHPA